MQLRERNIVFYVYPIEPQHKLYIDIEFYYADQFAVVDQIKFPWLVKSIHFESREIPLIFLGKIIPSCAIKPNGNTKIPAIENSYLNFQYFFWVICMVPMKSITIHLFLDESTIPRIWCKLTANCCSLPTLIVQVF